MLILMTCLFLAPACQYTHGHKFKLYKLQTNSCVRANFFSERVINCWNSLPHTVDFSSFSKFKRSSLWLLLRRFRQQVVVLSCGFIFEKVLVLSIY